MYRNRVSLFRYNVNLPKGMELHLRFRFFGCERDHFVYLDFPLPNKVYWLAPGFILTTPVNISLFGYMVVEFHTSKTISSWLTDKFNILISTGL